MKMGWIVCNSRLQSERKEIFERIRAKLAVIYQIYEKDFQKYRLYLLSECYELFGILKQYFELAEPQERESKRNGMAHKSL